MAKEKEKEKKEKKMKTGELKGMPERSALGVKASDWLNIKDEIARNQDELKECAEELCKMFNDSGEDMINIDGRVVKHRTVPAKDELRIVETSD